MNNAEQYLELQKQNSEFIANHNQILDQVDIKWELK